MSRITCKSCRRLGESLCGREKCAYKKRPYAPGKLDSERKHRSNVSEYGEQLRAKQKMRLTYGLMEKQFSMYVKRATASHDSTENTVAPSLKLARELESRLDNIVYRAGFANTRALARQLVSHGHILVNGRRINIASYQVKIGDVVSIREGSKSAKVFTGLQEKLTAMAPNYVMVVNPATFSAEIKNFIREVEPMFDTQKVLEYYSR
ncbi:MAG: 30S ribosomal protein S4 [Candidatus Pacebacteria bacterium]|nr:30S ribosomal protein S4 [Candidatus Paceibacterota bacterium]MBP9867259.1 30S ribosomal protein S4 [Candidatus Paceibacterota bacterium]